MHDYVVTINNNEIHIYVPLLNYTITYAYRHLGGNKYIITIIMLMVSPLSYILKFSQI